MALTRNQVACGHPDCTADTAEVLLGAYGPEVWAWRHLDQDGDPVSAIGQAEIGHEPLPSSGVSVWTLYGPDAGWGDGDGPLGYYPTEEAAQAARAEEESAVIDLAYEAWADAGRPDPEPKTYEQAEGWAGWPYALGRGYRVEEARYADLDAAVSYYGLWEGFENDDPSRYAQAPATTEALFEALNAPA